MPIILNKLLKINNLIKLIKYLVLGKLDFPTNLFFWKKNLEFGPYFPTSEGRVWQFLLKVFKVFTRIF